VCVCEREGDRVCACVRMSTQILVSACVRVCVCVCVCLVLVCVCVCVCV